MNKETCPHCGVSLLGNPIPEDQLHLFFPSNVTNPKHFLRTVGIEVQGVYDGVLYWQCPDCHGAWHRFAPDNWRHLIAQDYIDDTNTKRTARLGKVASEKEAPTTDQAK